MVRFKDELKTNKCDELKAKYKKGDENKCIIMIDTVGKILYDTVSSERR
ncbi:hypothetical protein CPJCM30710_11460 [Clostridium polyendosporum]|uniref:Uncharacterized protein n=1 Tax=Clostridium polyendosporum TaxID=69208 RepID=A0A919RZQ4_9CLOT|nr:hypothetical protein [Clostridium polyendosporum]GIM28480.1 hypothetical protein CPJCM30710_11460 [Clostridium polyendosporum]